jgi:hypothetical protein
VAKSSVLLTHAFPHLLQINIIHYKLLTYSTQAEANCILDIDTKSATYNNKYCIIPMGLYTTTVRVDIED